MVPDSSSHALGAPKHALHSWKFEPLGFQLARLARKLDASKPMIALVSSELDDDPP
jgi:hypothetical protein